MENREPKTHPILFSNPMVQAILENRKIQTRRTKGLEIVNENLDTIVSLELISDPDITYALIKTKSKGTYKLKCPYHVGDILWVRETFREIEQEVGSPRFEYKATETLNLSDKWKPSLFMPKQACRLFLEITKIRVEKLQEISNQDCKKEGIKREIFTPTGEECFYFYPCNDLRDDSYFDCPKTSFYSLWKSINGQNSWDANPFVWVYEFKINFRNL